MSRRKWNLLFLCFSILFTNVLCSNSNPEAREKAKSYKFPPCQACKIFVGSFKNFFEKTANTKFEGGNTDWEEKKLRKYADSEIRLTEIQEGLCSDISKGKDQCYTIAEETEELIEKWWIEIKPELPDLFDYLCIRTLKRCCPENHFGKNCDPCPGFPDNVCSENGNCKGAGTRKGNGQCACNSGYVGDMCDACAENYYESFRSEKNVLCTPCHVSCDGACTESGPKGCGKCKEGWLKDDKFGCVDNNECLVKKNICKRKEFCVNTEGSYMCYACDPSCETCDGDGPDMCKDCAENYVKRDGMCIAEEKVNTEWHVTVTRYLTYFGMCLCACIIFNKKPILAAVIGVLVALYIALSEYILTPSSDLGNRLFNSTSSSE